MRKEVEEIVSAKLNEGKIEGNSISIENLLQRLIKINEEQKELLSNNSKSSNILERLIFGFAGLALIIALASLQISASETSAGPGIFCLTYVLILIGLIAISAIVFTDIFKERENRHPILRHIINMILVYVVSLGVSLPIILLIFPQFDPCTLMVIIGIVYFIFCVGICIWKNKK